MKLPSLLSPLKVGPYQLSHRVVMAPLTRMRAERSSFAPRALNAEYLDNPSYQYLHQVITAHPLGGCPMGFTPDEGVVDSYGEVFGHRGLYVVDGSIMPGPVGPNPSLTIAAVSDRAADHIIDQFKGARP